MILFKRMTERMQLPSMAVALLTVTPLAAADEEAMVAFPDKWMIRLGAYIVDGSNTQFSINSDVGGLGTTIDYQRDLGGEDGDSIPRIDVYYRFNARHRIDFTSFSIERTGERAIVYLFPVDIHGFRTDTDRNTVRLVQHNKSRNWTSNVS